MINLCAFAPQPNCTFNADATAGHGFAIFMASVGALRTFGAPAPLTLGYKGFPVRQAKRIPRPAQRVCLFVGF